MQRLLGIEGVIVDVVQEITEAVSNTISSEQEESSHEQQMNVKARTKPNLSQKRACFLLNGEQGCSQNISLSSHIDNIIQLYQCK